MKKDSRHALALLWVLLVGMATHAQVQVDITQPVLPVLTGKEHNPVLKMSVVKGALLNGRMKHITLNLEGDISDIESVSLLPALKNGKPDAAHPLMPALPASKRVDFSHPLFLVQDTTTVWVSLKLKDKVDLTHRYRLGCVAVEVENQAVKLVQHGPLAYLRAGVAVRQQRQDNIYTSRIPGIATSKNQTLLAIYDARYQHVRDLQGNIDIALNRSKDGGMTWEPTQIVLDRRDWGNLPEKFNGVSDACVLVDDRTGTIFVAGLWMHGVLDGKTGKWVEGLTNDSTRWIHQWIAKGSQPGVDVKETSQFLITQSTDDGLTWSEPVNITAATKRPEWWLYAPAPGHGITLEDGTLVFPTQGRDANGVPFSNITYSKDGGKTWKASNPAYSNTTECMAVQLTDGSILLNMRDNRNRGNFHENGRRICVTRNLGETWTEHPTSRKALIEPTCMASIHKHVYIRNGQQQSILLFCNPESYSERNHITLKVSFDDGNSWPEQSKILLDEWEGAGYSCITSVDAETVGVFYESSQAQMVFQQIPLKELLGEKCE